MNENTISVNTDDIKNKVCPAVRDGKISLNDASVHLSNMKVPTDFYYYLKLNSIKNEISSISTELGKIDKKLIKVAEKFEGAENSGKNILSSLLGNSSLTLLSQFSLENNTTGRDKNFLEDINTGLGLILNAPILALTGAATLITLTADGINNIGYNVLGTEEQYQINLTKMMWNQTLGCVKESRAESMLNTGESSVINFGAGLGKGIAELGENLVDMATVSGAIMSSKGMIAGDIVKYMCFKLLGQEDKFYSDTINTWKTIMNFVAEEHIDNAFEGFYKNNSAGQWLDKNAARVLKSDGTITGMAPVIGKIGGILGLGMLVGAGAALAEGIAISQSVINAVIAGASGFGQAVQDYWANARDNARKGEDWRTVRTAGEGVALGTLNGLWEGLQWYLGAEITNGATTVIESARNIGIDTVFNAFDTPYRALTETLVTGKNIGEAFNERGGWSSVATSTAVGLIGSLGGEIFNHIKNGSDEAIQAIKKIDYGKLYDEDIDEIVKILHHRGFNDDQIMQIIDFNHDKESLVRFLESNKYAYDDTYLLEMSNEEVIKIAKERYKEFYNNNKELLSKYISEKDIDKAFSRIHVCKDHDEFVKEFGGEGAAGFNRAGEVYLPEYTATYETVIHEINHSLGSMSNNYIDTSLRLK